MPEKKQQGHPNSDIPSPSAFNPNGSELLLVELCGWLRAFEERTDLHVDPLQLLEQIYSIAEWKPFSGEEYGASPIKRRVNRMKAVNEAIDIGTSEAKYSETLKGRPPLGAEKKKQNRGGYGSVPGKKRGPYKTKKKTLVKMLTYVPDAELLKANIAMTSDEVKNKKNRLIANELTSDYISPTKLNQKGWEVPKKTKGKYKA